MSQWRSIRLPSSTFGSHDTMACPQIVNLPLNEHAPFDPEATHHILSAYT